ncbi:C39 family peptidase [Clostridium sp.]|uniref:C39 family peptidase n=1 Tax=Clostridium sp. TaxID=1506 RepID=UPI0034648C08
MKKLFTFFILALSFVALAITFKIYIYESRKVSALQDHMGFLASKGNISYMSSEEEAKLEKEEKKRKKEEEKAAKEEAKRRAKEEEEAKKAEEKRLKEEELQKKKEELEKALNASKEINLDVGIINQLPEYKNGCEATSLTMMLNYAGINVDKDSVIAKVKRDSTPIKYDSKGKIVEWGNPKNGFVGDITGKTPGYSIDPEALAPVINEYLPDKALDLSGCDYSELEKILSSGRPIVVWITSKFIEPKLSHTWTSNGETINSYFPQHAVLVTGMDEDYIYYNDPLTGVKNDKIDKETFKSVWTKMGKKALSYYK